MTTPKGKVGDIRVRFDGMGKAPGGEFSISYKSDKRQVLLPGVRYNIVIEGLSYEQAPARQT